jgi:hypothetical protein
VYRFYSSLLPIGVPFFAPGLLFGVGISIGCSKYFALPKTRITLLVIFSSLAYYLAVLAYLFFVNNVFSPELGNLFSSSIAGFVGASMLVAFTVPVLQLQRKFFVIPLILVMGLIGGILIGLSSPDSREYTTRGLHTILLFMLWQSGVAASYGFGFSELTIDH